MNFNSFVSDWPELDKEQGGKFKIKSKFLNATISGIFDGGGRNRVKLGFGPVMPEDAYQTLDSHDLYAMAMAFIMIAEDLADVVGEPIVNVDDIEVEPEH